MGLVTAAGLVGVALYLVSYALLQLGQIDGNGAPYTVANMLAAALVLLSLIDKFNLASLLIQVASIAFGAFGLAMRYLNEYRLRAQHEMQGH